MQSKKEQLQLFNPELAKELEILDDESISDYVKRVARLKNLTPFGWRDFAECVADVSGITRDESTFRKACVVEDVPEEDDTTPEEILMEMRKERVKIADERNQLGMYLRRISREDTIKEIAEAAANAVAKAKPLHFTPDYTYLSRKSNAEGLLLVSDWHYGIDFKNHLNTFNPDICRKRVAKLTDETLKRCEENNITALTVLNLSDLIAGRIHTQIRIQSREDVITQVMNVSEILSEMLLKLSEKMSIRYYDCLDNHSRLEPDKSQSLDLESLARIISFYLRTRLAGHNIQILDNEFSHDIITCNILGHNIVGVHGDFDKPLTALDKITLLTRKSYDLMCAAHLHHFSADEKCGCITIGNGSLMGADDYALRLRLFSKPSQTFIVVTPENVCEAIYKINLE